LIIAAICHGPLVLAKADVISGVEVTGYDDILNDLKDAGGVLVNKVAVRDRNIITGTDPSALWKFNRLLIEAIAEKVGSTS